MTLIFIETVYLDIELTKMIVTVARNIAILKLIINLKMTFPFIIESADVV